MKPKKKWPLKYQLFFIFNNRNFLVNIKDLQALNLSGFYKENSCITTPSCTKPPQLTTYHLVYLEQGYRIFMKKVASKLRIRKTQNNKIVSFFHGFIFTVQCTDKRYHFQSVCKKDSTIFLPGCDSRFIAQLCLLYQRRMLKGPPLFPWTYIFLVL